jgi:hypothetical protein
MTNETRLKLNELRKEIDFKNPKILEDIMIFFQKVIVLAVSLEEVDEKLIPRLVLGEEPVDLDSSKTREYTQPIMYLTLTRRASTGVNDRTLTDLFSNNLISGIPKFDQMVKKRVDEEDGTYEEYDVVSTMFKTDNELCLSLKTKTVKEQLTLLPVLERALNIYSQIVKPTFIDVCGVKNIATEPKKDETDFETAKITFQLRAVEQVVFDDTYIVRGFEIISKDLEYEGIKTNSGQIDESGKWIDNVNEEYEEFFN